MVIQCSIPSLLTLEMILMTSIMIRVIQAKEITQHLMLNKKTPLQVVFKTNHILRLRKLRLLETFHSMIPLWKKMRYYSKLRSAVLKLDNFLST
jgi:hypothetical protein